MTSILGIIYAMQVSSFGIANLEAEYGVRLFYRIVIEYYCFFNLNRYILYRIS